MIARPLIAVLTAFGVTATPAADFDGASLAELAKANSLAATAYVAGFVQGWHAHIAIEEGIVRSRGIPKETWARVMTDGRVMFCLPGDLTTGQALDLVLAFIAAHPDEGAKPAPTLVWKAFVTAHPCKNPAKSVAY